MHYEKVVLTHNHRPFLILWVGLRLIVLRLSSILVLYLQGKGKDVRMRMYPHALSMIQIRMRGDGAGGGGGSSYTARELTKSTISELARA